MGEIDEAIELITSDASGYVTSNEWDGRIDRGILDKNLLDGKVSDGEREVMHSLLDLITAFANPDGNAELAPLVGVEEKKVAVRHSRYEQHGDVTSIPRKRCECG